MVDATTIVAIHASRANRAGNRCFLTRNPLAPRLLPALITRRIMEKSYATRPIDIY